MSIINAHTHPQSSLRASPAVSDSLNEVGWVRKEKQRPVVAGIRVANFVDQGLRIWLMQLKETTICC